ncbi:MAG: TIGR01212 family radical SAM protein [Lachnospiraceae bacterium]|nr:TIGR01212 family radical SAM protein [Lachnospiraceae bacterium]
MQSNPISANNYPSFWLDKPYYSLNAYCRKTFHEKLYRIAVDAGMTCPNRDGTLDTRGCIFCSAGGSGDFAVKTEDLSVAQQIDAGVSLFHEKRTGSRFIAYFQAYTNTYAPVSRLRFLYMQALKEPKVAGISIATRPDCLPPDVLALLAELKAAFPDKFIWIELGLQTIHEQSAAYIRRGYPLSCFIQAAAELARLQIPLIVHVILGLPGETTNQMYETIRLLNLQPVSGIKLQLLHVLENTDLAADYIAGKFQVLSFDTYVNLVIGILERLSPRIVIHRLTGDGPKNLLIAPKWSLDKRKVLNTIHHEMRVRNVWQGKRLEEER